MPNTNPTAQPNKSGRPDQDRPDSADPKNAKSNSQPPAQQAGKNGAPAQDANFAQHAGKPAGNYPGNQAGNNPGKQQQSQGKGTGSPSSSDQGGSANESPAPHIKRTDSTGASAGKSNLPDADRYNDGADDDEPTGNRDAATPEIKVNKSRDAQADRPQR